MSSVSSAPAEDTLPRGWDIALLIGLLVLCYGIAAVGGLSTSSAVQTWYPTLDKPPWTPPGWVFGPVWTVLYGAIAVAGWRVFRQGVADRPVALGLFSLQLVLNALWSPVFFGAQAPTPALVVISLMWLAVAACIAVFWRFSRLAAVLLVPYLAWLCIAWSLNAWIVAYN